MPGFVRARPCCRRPSSAAGASSRRSRVRSASAASSAAPPATAAPNGPRSRKRLNTTTRQRLRACVPVAGSPTWPTARTPRPSSRSKSRPTRAGSSVPVGAAVATAHRRPWKYRRPRCRGCSRGRRTEPACGHASCTSATPVCGLCTGSPHGCRTRGCRSRSGRWPTACPAPCRCSSRSTKRSSRTRAGLRCAMATRPSGASSR